MADDLSAIDMRVVADGLEEGIKLKISDRGPTDFLVPEDYSMKEIVTKIGSIAGRRPIRRLTLMCHGLGMLAEGDINPRNGEQMNLPAGASRLVSRIYGGYGLIIGDDLLNGLSVRDWAPLKGRFTATGLIVVCGCAAADSGPTHTTSRGKVMTGDGPALMKALSATTGASVVAAVQLQELAMDWYLGTVDRGPFVGPTYLFKPDGSQTLNLASY
jgi:hypothetical protein